MRESFHRADFSSAMQQDAHKEGRGCPLLLSSDLLNLLSPHAESQIAPQYLGVPRSLFRQHHHDVRFTWDHPSLILISSFPPDGMPVQRWKCVFGTGLLTSSFPCVFCLPSMLASWHHQPDSVPLCVASGYIQPEQSTWSCPIVWKENGRFSTVGWCQFLQQLSCFGGVNKIVTFFPLGFCSATVLCVGFHWHQKSRWMW